jgi:YHS domain-containing protein
MTALILKALLVLFVARAIWRLVRGILKGLQEGASVGPGREPPVALSRDPICGTYVVPGRALALRDGPLVRYFCSERCRDEYARAPRVAR